MLGRELFQGERTRLGAQVLGLVELVMVLVDFFVCLGGIGVSTEGRQVMGQEELPVFGFRLWLEGITPFYPSVISTEEEHPTSAKFVVVDTGDERGKGLRSKIAFYKDEHVARLSGVIVNHTTLDTIQITPTLYFSDPWFCRFLLHSCDPNLEINLEHLDVRALKNILPSDYLTIDYAATEDKVTIQFTCTCGAPECRGWVTGRAEEINEEGRSHLAKQGLKLLRKD